LIVASALVADIGLRPDLAADFPQPSAVIAPMRSDTGRATLCPLRRKEATMKPTAISLEEYEAAERELAATHARRFWFLHASLFVVALGSFAIVEAAANGGLWWPYLVLTAWALVLLAHYRRSIRYGDAHAREQQIRIEWRAGRSRDELVPR